MQISGRHGGWSNNFVLILQIWGKKTFWIPKATLFGWEGGGRSQIQAGHSPFATFQFVSTIRLMLLWQQLTITSNILAITFSSVPNRLVLEAGGVNA